MTRAPREKLIGLLDYIEQAVRLDERVAFRLSEYRLPDGTDFAVGQAETGNLPGVHHDLGGEEGSVWLDVARLSRKEPPPPPVEIVDWIVLSSDPARSLETRSQRLVTVTAAERDRALAGGEVRAEDVADAPRRRDAPPDEAPRFDLTLRLCDRPKIVTAIETWKAGPWTTWATEEMPRRKTIALYQRLYKIFQMVEVGGESKIEVMWGVGVVHWEKDGRVIDRPLIEVRVDIEMDDAQAGLIRIRPTTGEPQVDLKPYEELGCIGLPGFSDFVRQAMRRAEEEGGVSPFNRESFEPILSAAAAQLDFDGCYAPDMPPESAANSSRLTVTDKWVLFARPRSQHVLLQDVSRLRQVAEDRARPIGGLAEHIVTEPSRAPPGEWMPLGSGGSGPGGNGQGAGDNPSFDDFFPKPYNDDQIEILRRLSCSDGLVIQGPPGTGKTHTIANLICHAMATGQRVLVVSKGEAALAVLKDQLPREVQTLAISVLASERQGLRQVESTLREIHALVEGRSLENMRLSIGQIQTEIDRFRNRIAAIDGELDSIAEPHLSKMGPRGETPAELALRIVSERDAFLWFIDRPLRFSVETGLTDLDMVSLAEARQQAGDWLDHLETILPSPADLPKPEEVAAWHTDLLRIAQLQDAVSAGPIGALNVTADNAKGALNVAEVLERLVAAYPASLGVPWIEPLWRSAITGEQGDLLRILRERLGEWGLLEAEVSELASRAVDLPQGLLHDENAVQAVRRAASGEKLWPLLSVGKKAAKALVDAIRLDGLVVAADDIQGWRHVDAFVAHSTRRVAAAARWNAFTNEMGAPTSANHKHIMTIVKDVFGAADAMRLHRDLLSVITSGSIGTNVFLDDPDLCSAIAKQVRAAASGMRLAAVHEQIRRTAEFFDHGTDETSRLARRVLRDAVGNPDVPDNKIIDLWHALLQRLETIKARAKDFSTIIAGTDQIEKAGAPVWAGRLRMESATQGGPLLGTGWRDAWDHAAAEANLAHIDPRNRLTSLAEERERADEQCTKLLATLVRERTCYALKGRLSPAVMAALVEFLNALKRIGKGTGKAADHWRRVAREAMSRCYDALPCWIMPTWRVAESLPA